MKLPRKRWIALGLALLLIPGGIAARRLFARPPETVLVERHTVREVIEVTGTVKANMKVVLKSEASGPVMAYLAKENQPVPAGAPLLAIAPQRAQLDMAQARENARQTLDQATSSRQTARDQLAEEQLRVRQDDVSQGGTVAKAVETLARAEAELARGERLLAQGAVTRQSVDEQRQQRTNARLDLATAREAHARTRAGEGLARARHAVEQAEAGLSRAKAQTQVTIAKATQDLAKATVRAPFAGVVTTWSVMPGDLVSPGTALATFEDLADLRLVLPVDELDLPRITPDMPVTITFDAFPGDKVSGKVVRISRSSTAGAENVEVFPVEVAIPASEHRIKPGMNGDASFVLREKRDVLTVPAQSVLRVAGKPVVMKLDGRKPVEVPITTGIVTVERYEVLTGLQEGDKVLATPQALPSPTR